MAEIIDFKDEWKRRLQFGSQKAREALSELDPNSETYFNDCESVAKLVKEVNDDYKNFGEFESSTVQNSLEKEKNEDEKKNNWIRSAISVGTAVLYFVMFAIGEHSRNVRVDKVVSFEDDHAILKSAEKIAVSDALREDKKSFLPFFSGK